MTTTQSIVPIRKAPGSLNPASLLLLLAALGMLAVLAVLSGCRSTAPTPSPKPFQTGKASWYGSKFHGRLTANGERFDMNDLTAAHKTLPFGTLIEVENLDNGRKVTVRINDRGPFVGRRILDLSRSAADTLGLRRAGIGAVAIYILAMPNAPDACHTLQAGAFRSQERAEERRKALEEGPFASRVADRGDGWFRVQIGFFERRGDAEKARRNLEKEGVWAVVLPSPCGS